MRDVRLLLLLLLLLLTKNIVSPTAGDANWRRWQLKLAYGRIGEQKQLL